MGLRLSNWAPKPTSTWGRRLNKAGWRNDKPGGLRAIINHGCFGIAQSQSSANIEL